MRKRLTLLTAVVVASLIAAVAAWAGNPHFLRFDDPTIVSGGSAGTTARTLAATTTTGGDPRVLIDNIVIAGVKEGVTSRLTAPYEAIYVCVNANHVPDPDHQTTLVRTLTTSAEFPAARNGRAEGSLLTPPLPSPEEAAAATGFACPAGEQLVLDRVVFSNLVLSADGGETIALDVVLVWTAANGSTG